MKKLYITLAAFLLLGVTVYAFSPNETEMLENKVRLANDEMVELNRINNGHREEKKNLEARIEELEKQIESNSDRHKHLEGWVKATIDIMGFQTEK